MNLKSQLKNASLLILGNQIKKISDGGNFGEMWEVDLEKKYTVRLNEKANYSYLTCDCMFCSVHNMTQPICSHKLGVIMLEMQNMFK